MILSKKSIKGLLLLLVLTIATVAYAKAIDPETIVAEIDNKTITYGDIEKEIAKIPPMYQQRFKTVDSQKQLLQSIVTKELFMAKALKEGFDKDENFNAKFNDSLKPYYIDTHSKKFVDDLVNLSDEDLMKYYQINLPRYTIKPKAAILYIGVASDSIATIVSKQLEEGVDFIDILNKYSINNYSKKRSGKISNIKASEKSDYLPGVGKDKVLLQEILKADMNKFYGPIKTEKGIHFFNVVERTPENVKSFETVKTQVYNDMYPGEKSKIYLALKDRLFEKYDVDFNPVLDTIKIGKVNKNHHLANEYAIQSNNNDIKMTFLQLADEFRKTSSQQRAEMQEGNSTMFWIKKTVERNVAYADALENIERDEVLESQNVKDRYNMDLIRFAYKQIVTDKIDTSDDKIEAYYNKNAKDFTNKPFRNIRYFVYENDVEANKAYKKAKKIVKKNYDSEKEEAKLIKKIGKNNLVNDKFVIENIFKDKMIAGQGNDKELMSNVWSTNVNALSPVFTNKDGKFAFLQVIHETPEMKRPISEVRNKIKKLITRTEAKRLYTESFDSLAKEFNLKLHEDRLVVKLTIDEMYDLADQYQKQRKFNDAIGMYDQIISAFPGTDDAYKAEFMKAFVLAENMNQKERALKLFQEFVSKYKKADANENSSLVISAEYMIETLQNPENSELKFEE